MFTDKDEEIEEPEDIQEPEDQTLDTEESDAELTPAEEAEETEETKGDDSPIDEDLKEELEEEGFVVTLEGEDSDASEDETKESKSESTTFRELRRLLRAKEKELKQIKASQPSARQPDEATIELGKKPDLWDEEIDGDAEKHSEALIAWKERKAQLDSREEKKREKLESERKAFEQKRQNYKERAAALKAPDFEEIELVAAEALDQVTQSLIVDQAKEPEKIVYAIGKREDIRKQFQSVTGNPVQKALQVGRILERLEKSMNITTKRKAPAAETTVVGHTSSTGSYETMLAKAEREAEKTGDRSKIIALKRAHLKKQK